MAKPHKYAGLDANVLINLAKGRGQAIDCLKALKRNARACFSIFAPPTTLIELTYKSDDPDPSLKGYCRKALQNMSSWGISPKVLEGYEMGIAEQIADQLRRYRVIPEEEKHDSYIVAECCVAGMDMLISTDDHILDMNTEEFNSIILSYECNPPFICHPSTAIRALS
jgi:hypothetical protein